MNALTIYKCVRGSRATSLNTPNSDTDLFEVVIPPVDCLLGLQEMKGSQKMDKASGEDSRIITLKELIRQAIHGRSTEVEWLFVDPEHVIEQHPVYGRELELMRDNLVSARMYKSMLGFATGNRQAAINGNKDRFREDLGYDPKALSHALRALWQAIMLKKHGRVVVAPVGDYKETILAVKYGQLSRQVALDRFATWDHRLNSMPENPQVRSKPDHELLNNWLVSVHSDYLDQKG